VPTAHEQQRLRTLVWVGRERAHTCVLVCMCARECEGGGTGEGAVGPPSTSAPGLRGCACWLVCSPPLQVPRQVRFFYHILPKVKFNIVPIVLVVAGLLSVVAVPGIYILYMRRRIRWERSRGIYRDAVLTLMASNDAATKALRVNLRFLRDYPRPYLAPKPPPPPPPPPVGEGDLEAGSGEGGLLAADSLQLTTASTVSSQRGGPKGSTKAKGKSKAPPARKGVGPKGGAGAGAGAGSKKPGGKAAAAGK
jgi:hypothetical protein